MVGEIIEVRCIKCGEEDGFYNKAPPRFVCQDCKEKEQEKD